jgi:hypothetical protein
MNFMKKLILIILLMCLSGCAATQKIAVDRSIIPQLKGKSLVQVQRESPTFVAMTSGKGMFAVAGVAAAASAGNQLVADNQINDPALPTGEAVAESLVNEYGLINNGQTNVIIDSNSIDRIVAEAKGNDYALDVVTNGWSFIYDGFKFSEYLVGCSIKLRMIDVQAAKTIAEGLCAYDTKTAGKPNVSYEALLENDAAYIKHTLADATEYCANQFKTELF